MATWHFGAKHFICSDITFALSRLTLIIIKKGNHSAHHRHDSFINAVESHLQHRQRKGKRGREREPTASRQHIATDTSGKAASPVSHPQPNHTAKYEVNISAVLTGYFASLK